jgi:Zinc-finger of C2H2 type
MKSFLGFVCTQNTKDNINVMVPANVQPTMSAQLAGVSTTTEEIGTGTSTPTPTPGHAATTSDSTDTIASLSLLQAAHALLEAVHTPSCHLPTLTTQDWSGCGFVPALTQDVQCQDWPLTFRPPHYMVYHSDEHTASLSDTTTTTRGNHVISSSRTSNTNAIAAATRRPSAESLQRHLTTAAAQHQLAIDSDDMGYFMTKATQYIKTIGVQNPVQAVHHLCSKRTWLVPQVSSENCVARLHNGQVVFIAKSIAVQRKKRKNLLFLWILTYYIRLLSYRGTWFNSIPISMNGFLPHCECTNRASAVNKWIVDHILETSAADRPSFVFISYHCDTFDTSAVRSISIAVPGKDIAILVYSLYRVSDSTHKLAATDQLVRLLESPQIDKVSFRHLGQHDSAWHHMTMDIKHRRILDLEFYCSALGIDTSAPDAMQALLAEFSSWTASSLPKAIAGTNWNKPTLSPSQVVYTISELVWLSLVYRPIVQAYERCQKSGSSHVSIPACDTTLLCRMYSDTRYTSSVPAHNDTSNTTGSNSSHRGLLHCHLCQVDCLTTESYSAHVEGVQHKKNVVKCQRISEAKQNPPSDVHLYLDESHPYLPFQCTLCVASFSDRSSYEVHAAGAKHQRKLHEHRMRAQNSVDAGRIANTTNSNLCCYICALTFTARGQLNIHLRGSQHAKRVAVAKSWLAHEPTGYCCETCLIECTASSALSAHLNSTQHSRKALIRCQIGDGQDTAGIGDSVSSSDSGGALSDFDTKCKLCYVSCTSRTSLQQHINRADHQAKVVQCNRRLASTVARIPSHC